jgi:hypothetical protein
MPGGRRQAAEELGVSAQGRANAALPVDDEAEGRKEGGRSGVRRSDEHCPKKQQSK